MKFLALNLLLAIVWTFLAGSFTVESMLFGFVVSFAVLAAAQSFLGSGGYVRATVGVLLLLRVYLWEIIRANLQLARDLLRMKMPFKPGFIHVDASALSPAETAVLANMISLTPGTLTVDVNEEGDTLYVHTVYAADPEKVRAGIRLFANLIVGATGPRAPRGDEEARPWQV